MYCITSTQRRVWGHLARFSVPTEILVEPMKLSHDLGLEWWFYQSELGVQSRTMLDPAHLWSDGGWRRLCLKQNWSWDTLICGRSRERQFFRFCITYFGAGLVNGCLSLCVTWCILCMLTACACPDIKNALLRNLKYPSCSRMWCWNLCYVLICKDFKVWDNIQGGDAVAVYNLSLQFDS